jgi:hypothetical protein
VAVRAEWTRPVAILVRVLRSEIRMPAMPARCNRRSMLRTSSIDFSLAMPFCYLGMLALVVMRA